MMLFKSKKVIGLDIGTSTIKIAEMDVSRKVSTLVNFAMVPTPQGCMAGGELLDPAILAGAIQQLLSEIKTKRKLVATGLWGNSVIVKKINIPKMDEKLIAEQIQWEAEQYIPFDINEVSLDFKVLERSANQDPMEVLIIAAKNDQVAKYAQAIEQVGLQLSVLDVSGFALANTFAASYEEYNTQTVALLNIGASVTNFVVIDRGEIVFCRDIPVGGITYTGEIQKALGISPEEAESMKLSLISGQPTPEEVSNVIQATHPFVCDEINGSFDFFGNTNPSGPIGQCFVTGGASRTPGLLTLLSQTTKMQCQNLDPFKKIRYSEKTMTHDYVHQITDFSAIVVGLSLRNPGDK